MAMTPKCLLAMADVTMALTQGAPVRVQIDDVTRCYSQGSAKPAAMGIAHDIDTAYIKTISNKTMVQIFSETEVKGEDFNLTGPVLQQVTILIHEDGTLDVNGTTWNPVKGHLTFSSWELKCRWNNKTSNGSAQIYQQDAWGEEMSEFQSLQAAVESGYALAFLIDLSIVDPPGDGLWLGKIHGTESWHPSAISFTQRWTNGTDVTVMAVAVQATDSVLISHFTYRRSSGEVGSFVKRKGFFNFKGSIHFFKMSYET